MTTRKKKWILVIAILVMIPSILVLGTIAVVERRLDAELAKIEARGEPIAFEDIVPPPVPDEENGAVELVRAFAMLPENTSDLPVLGVDISGVTTVALTKNEYDWLIEQSNRRSDSWSNEEVERIRAGLTECEPVFETIRQGLSKPGVRFDICYEDCWGALIPHLNYSRIAAKLLSVESELAFRNGETERAIDSIETVFGLAKSLDSEPILISQLVGRAIRQIGLVRIQEMALSGRLTRVQMLRLAEILAPHIRHGAAKRWLMDERVWLREGFEWIKDNNGSGDLGLDASYDFLCRFDTFVSANQTVALRSMEQIVDHADKCMRDYKGTMGPEDYDFPEWAVLARALVMATSRIVPIEAESQAIIRSAHVALKTGARLKGGMPRADALALPEGPGGIDPYDGNPLHLRIGESGREVTAYSVGPNFLDDKGRPYLEPIVEWIDPETGEPPEVDESDPFRPLPEHDPNSDLERIEKSPDEDDPANFWNTPDTPAPGTPDDLRFRVRLVPKEG